MKGRIDLVGDAERLVALRPRTDNEAAGEVDFFTP
jgi:hypothetical protein